MKHIYTSLDIGSDSIKTVVCELYQNKLNLLASSSYQSKGIKKGFINIGNKLNPLWSPYIEKTEKIFGAFK